MTPLLRPAVLASLSVSFMLALPGAAPAQDLPGSITGRVTDGTSRAVAGASVQLVESGDPPGVAFSPLDVLATLL